MSKEYANKKDEEYITQDDVKSSHRSFLNDFHKASPYFCFFVLITTVCAIYAFRDDEQLRMFLFIVAGCSMAMLFTAVGSNMDI